jgi:hypothetical protein
MVVAASGPITWTPSEFQGPGVYPVLIKVTDNGAPAISVTNTFTLTISEVNVAPVITVPGPQTIHAGATLSTNATATDADLPPNTLTFAKVSGPPSLTVSGAGLIQWATVNTNANTTNAVSVRVFDNGTPSLSATGTFNVIVRSAPVLQTPVLSTTNVTLTWTTIPGTSYRLEFKTNLNFTNWVAVAGDVSAIGATASKPDAFTNSARFHRIRVLP